MTKAFKLLSLFAAGLLSIGTVACSEETFDMPQPNITPAELVEGVAFTVEHDAQNPNIIHLTSMLPASYQVAWVTPQGRKTGNEATLQIAFDGDYEVQMGVGTRGGYVWSNPYTFTISDFCAEFVDHFLWKRLSGGVGQSKTWQLDLGVLEDGSIRTTTWTGPHWYWNSNYTWDHLHAAAETESTYANYRDSDPWDKATAINPETVPADASGDEADWYWAADFMGNKWMLPDETARNFGYMTLDLINGANVTITDADGNIVSKGTYMIDVDNHMLSFSDTYPLETTNTNTHVRDFKLLYLSDDAMQLIPDLPNQNVTSLNYVTKEYFDNYVVPAPSEPVLPDGWKDDISQTVITSVKWVLSERNPLDWANLDGSLMNGWTSLSDYPDWLGTPDPESYADFSMTLDSSDNTAVFAYPDGTELECTYELNNKGIYTFSEPVPSFTIVGWASFAVDADNSLRILSIEKDALGNIKGIWLGAISSEKPEYMAYHFTPKAGEGGGIGSTGPAIVAKLNFFSDGWKFTSDATTLITGTGKYSVKIKGTAPDCYGMYLDFWDVLPEYPNADAIITDIQVDGKSIDFKESDISRSKGDDASCIRRYIVNPWGASASLKDFCAYNESIEVFFDFYLDTGTPFPFE